MTRVTSQHIRQAILVVAAPLDPDILMEKLQLFDEEGHPISLSGGYRRNSVDHTTAVLAPGATENSVLTVAPAWRPFKVVTNRPARIRIYPTAAYRTLDATRPKEFDPPLFSDHGLLFEMITAVGYLTYHLTPSVDMASDSEGSSDFYMAVTNMDTVAASVITTYSYIRTE